MGVSRLGSLLQDSVQFERWVLVDIDIRKVTFLSDSKMLLIGVYSDGTYAISVLTVERRILLCLQIVGLILVSSDEDDRRGRQEVNVVTLH
jgi:hypothetical protein